VRNKYVNKAKALREQWTSELAKAKAEKIKQEATEKALKREQENPRAGLLRTFFWLSLFGDRTAA
jgi:hypothetical protein